MISLFLMLGIYIKHCDSYKMPALIYMNFGGKKMKTLMLLIFSFFVLIISVYANEEILNSNEIDMEKTKETPSIFYGVREDGFCFKIEGNLYLKGKLLSEFNEVDFKTVKYPALYSDITVFFPRNNFIQINTGYLLKTKLQWKKLVLKSSDGKYKIKTKELLRLSTKKSSGEYHEFNEIFSDVISEKMTHFDIKPEESLETYIYQFDGKNLHFIRKSKLSKKIKNTFSLRKGKFDKIKNIKKEEISVFYPYMGIMYLSNGYKIRVEKRYIKKFENNDNSRRLFIVTTPSLKKKAEKLYLFNIEKKYDNLPLATSVFKTLGIDKSTDISQQNLSLSSK